MADGAVQGLVHDKYAGARAAFEANLDSGADVGASFCAATPMVTVLVVVPPLPSLTVTVKRSLPWKSLPGV